MAAIAEAIINIQFTSAGDELVTGRGLVHILVDGYLEIGVVGVGGAVLKSQSQS